MLFFSECSEHFLGCVCVSSVCECVSVCVSVCYCLLRKRQQVTASKSSASKQASKQAERSRTFGGCCESSRKRESVDECFGRLGSSVALSKNRIGSCTARRTYPGSENLRGAFAAFLDFSWLIEIT